MESPPNLLSKLFTKKKNLELLVTLWPSFPHFRRFCDDSRISGIRLNTAMVNNYELESEFGLARSFNGIVPLYFDIKGRQLRVDEVYENPDHLELKLNHPIKVQTPTVVLFKAGADRALLKEVKDERHLIFDGGPSYLVKPGESLHIRHPSLDVQGEQFTEHEKEKIATAMKAGFNNYFLSYVQSQKDVDEFREYIGSSELFLKIEDKRGLEYVTSQFKKTLNTHLMAARGDMYVELDRPHQILGALKTIISKDPEAGVGSRILLSSIHDAVPSCSDFCEMAWLYDIGYRKMMLCDELCLKEDLLSRAINAFEAFKETYTKTK